MKTRIMLVPEGAATKAALDRYPGWGLLWQEAQSILLQVKSDELYVALNSIPGSVTLPPPWASIQRLPETLLQLGPARTNAKTAGDFVYDLLGHSVWDASGAI